jgi:hypothetical protein
MMIATPLTMEHRWSRWNKQSRLGDLSQNHHVHLWIHEHEKNRSEPYLYEDDDRNTADDGVDETNKVAWKIWVAVAAAAGLEGC